MDGVEVSVMGWGYQQMSMSAHACVPLNVF